jgi:ribose transport system substrate-binding protein
MDNRYRPALRSCRILLRGRHVAELQRRLPRGVEIRVKGGTMKAKKLAAAVVLVLLTACISGCGRHSRKEVYYLISVSTKLPYWQTVAAGFYKAAVEYGVTARVTGPEDYDPQAELAELQKAVAAKPAGILISVADATVLSAEINSAVNAGIPVITVDSDAVGSRRLYFIGTNNLDAGRMAGHRVVDRLQGTGNVVIYTLAGQPNIEERLKGIKDVFADNPNIKIVDVVDIKGNTIKAFDMTKKYMAQTGADKVNAFVCLDSASGKMVADAIKQTQATDRVLVAWDVNQDTLDAIKDGEVDSTVAQKPYTMGYVGLRALDQVYHNPPKNMNHDWSADPFSPYPVFIDTGTSLVDKGNVDMYLNAAERMKP